MPKRMTIPAVLVVIAAIIGFTMYQRSINGSTAESRAQILNQKYIGAHIVTEETIDNWIVSAITTDDGKQGLVVFEPKDGGFKIADEIIVSTGKSVSGKSKINKVSYDLFWFNRSDLAEAELTYSANGKKNVETLDASDNKIIYSEAPQGTYVVNIVCRDVEGNTVEQ